DKLEDVGLCRLFPQRANSPSTGSGRTVFFLKSLIVPLVLSLSKHNNAFIRSQAASCDAAGMTD
ncbi:MAG: hypothetical protein ACYC6S_11060, partial [Desulfobulbia bacterium]